MLLYCPTLYKIPKFHLISWCGNLQKRTYSRKSQTTHPKLYRNSAFSENFHTRKVGEIMVLWLQVSKFRLPAHVLSFELFETFENTFSQNISSSWFWQNFRKFVDFLLCIYDVPNKRQKCTKETLLKRVDVKV